MSAYYVKYLFCSGRLCTLPIPQRDPTLYNHVNVTFDFLRNTLEIRNVVDQVFSSESYIYLFQYFALLLHVVCGKTNVQNGSTNLVP